MADTDENPYIGVAMRKSRNLKKKYDKILKAEVQLKAGKALNEEQLLLIASKPSVERALSDIESIRVQLEEVARELASVNIGATVTVSTEVPLSLSSPSKASQSEASTDMPHVLLVATASQVEMQPAKAAVDTALVESMVQNQVHKLLRTLHVCSRYHNITGTPLPPDVDYFGKCLLGLTSIGDFQDALEQSVRDAALFLDPVQGAENEAIRGMNYIELSQLIDSLAGHMHIGSSGNNSSVDAILDVLASPSVPPTTINFFATTHNEVPSSVEVATPTVDSVPPPAASEGVKKERKPRPPRRKENDKKPVVPEGASGVAATAPPAAAAVVPNEQQPARPAGNPWATKTEKPAAAVDAKTSDQQSAPRSDVAVQRGGRGGRGRGGGRGEGRGPSADGGRGASGRGAPRKPDNRPKPVSASPVAAAK